MTRGTLFPFRSHALLRFAWLACLGAVLLSPFGAGFLAPTPARASTIVTPATFAAPLKARYTDAASEQYYRNPWDMQTFNGKIYIGSGDATLNAGGIETAGGIGTDVWTFDPNRTTGPRCGGRCDVESPRL